jgi:hypothetical protein
MAAFTVEIQTLLGLRKKTVAGPWVRCEQDAINECVRMQALTDRHGKPMCWRGEIVDAYRRLAGKPLPPSAIRAMEQQPSMVPIFLNLK